MREREGDSIRSDKVENMISFEVCLWEEIEAQTKLIFN